MTTGGENATKERMKIIAIIAKKIRDFMQKIKTPQTKKILKTIFACFLVFLGWVISLQYFTADKYNAMVRIGENSGAENADIHAIDYGTLSKGDSAARFVTVENKGNHKIYIKVVTIGNISQILQINRNNFTILPQNKDKIQLFLEVPRDAEKMQYEGRILIFKIPEIF